MSLTTLIQDPEIKSFFKTEFLKPQFNMTSNIKAEPLSKNYTLMGTAFDYLLRVYLSRLNNIPIKKLVADGSLNLIGSLNLPNKNLLYDDLERYIEEFREHYMKYIVHGRFNRELFKSCLVLAQIDVIYRAGIVPPDLGVVNEADIDDLQNLIGLVKERDFKSNKICLLNPTFGVASILVSGADADLVLDNNLIDIKTTKNLRFDTDMFNQLIGYYLLYKLGGFDCEEKVHIDNLGIYFSRHGILYSFPIENVLKEEKMDYYLKFVKEKAEEKFNGLNGLREIIQEKKNKIEESTRREEVRPEYLKKLKEIQKGKYHRFNSVEEMKAQIEK